MKKEYFKVKLLSDIVLQATSNNEGKIMPFDYIPGSNFLGIVAKKYDEFKNPFDVFHSGKIRFNDATPLIDKKFTYKMPYSLFFEKNKDKKRCFNHHLIADFSKYEQLKQKREGFITDDFYEIKISLNYLQKSAYDKTKRRSKENAMYGYESIQKTYEFCFSIEYDEDMEDEFLKVKKFLLGTQRVGKSKSAQYGLVKISEYENIENSIEKDSDFDILYCQSRIALFDENGNFTSDPKYICDGLKIDYEKSQIRTLSFTPFNKSRERKDYERFVIDSGSVIVLKERLTQKQKEEIKNGVGGYLSEGFGKVLINPSFLLEKEINFKEYEFRNESIENKEITNNIIKYLLLKKEKENKELELIKKAKDFREKNKKIYSDIKASQWGAIRAILNSEIKNYEKRIKEYISNGIRKWNDEQIKILTKYLDNKDLLKLIVILMQKEAKQKEEK